MKPLPETSDFVKSNEEKLGIAQTTAGPRDQTSRASARTAPRCLVGVRPASRPNQIKSHGSRFSVSCFRYVGRHGFLCNLSSCIWYINSLYAWLRAIMIHNLLILNYPSSPYLLILDNANERDVRVCRCRKRICHVRTVRDRKV